MQYALALPNGGICDARTLGEFASLAEQSGWDGVFIEDYIVYQGKAGTPTYDPWVCLAAMAMRTERIRLGTMVTPLARRRPWKVAADTITLDHLSQGRIVLGVGLGDTGESVSSDLSFTHFGELMPAKQRAQMLDEALDIVAGLYSGQPFRYAGKHYRVREVQLLPPPVQQPRIPIWIGGGYPLKGPTQRATRWDGACLYKHRTHYLAPDDLRTFRTLVQRTRGTLDGYDIAVGGTHRRVDWDEERAYIRAMADAGATWWSEYVEPAAFETMRAAVVRGPLRIE